MLPPAIEEQLLDEYLGDNEDPKTLMTQFQEMMADGLFVMPSLHVAHFQREFPVAKASLGGALPTSLGLQGGISCAESYPFGTHVLYLDPPSCWFMRWTSPPGD